MDSLNSLNRITYKYLKTKISMGLKSYRILNVLPKKLYFDFHFETNFASLESRNIAFEVHWFILNI